MVQRLGDHQVDTRIGKRHLADRCTGDFRIEKTFSVDRALTLRDIEARHVCAAFEKTTAALAPNAHRVQNAQAAGLDPLEDSVEDLGSVRQRVEICVVLIVGLGDPIVIKFLTQFALGEVRENGNKIAAGPTKESVPLRFWTGP